ncbi:MAG: CapA family protein [Caulobacteraceae bacterium]
MAEPLKIFMVGDLVLDEPNADSFFDLSRGVLAQADLLVGHVEVPHTLRGVESVGDVPAPASAPENLAALGRAHFDVATLAGNHIHDRGSEGIEDTRSLLLAQGIAVTGAGRDLNEAREPAIVERGGRRIGVLSYNCVGPKEGFAEPGRAGCAYVRIIDASGETCAPSATAAMTTAVDPPSLAALQGEVETLKRRCDLVIVAFHKGVVHTPAVLMTYERRLARAALDAGADIVTASHAHILRGVETYRGKPIFHGLGNFVTVTRALSVEGNDSPVRKAWAEKRKQLFGFEPDPNYPTYAFHPEAKNAVIATVEVGEDGKLTPGFIPCWITPTGAPEVLGPGKKFDAVAAYVADITARAGMSTRFDRQGGRVTFSS